jgi:hypothetical protein
MEKREFLPYRDSNSDPSSNTGALENLYSGYSLFTEIANMHSRGGG